MHKNMLKRVELCFHNTFHSCPMCGNVEGRYSWGVSLLRLSSDYESKDTSEASMYNVGCRGDGTVARGKIIHLIADLLVV